VFCDSCCILPSDSVSTLFVGSLNKSTNKQSPNNGKQTGSADETSLASMRICDGEIIKSEAIVQILDSKFLIIYVYSARTLYENE
jgi:hypothetical protein